MRASRSSSPIVFVIGGGIGSGKSAFVSALGDLGAFVIEADRIGHEILQPAGGAFTPVATRWPQVVRGGRIDRKALAAIVFSDADQLAELERLTHPEIRRRIQELIRSSRSPAALEVPVLASFVDGPAVRVFIDAAEPTRLSRVVARGGDPSDVERRMEAQVDREVWLEWADRVIDNSGTLEELRAQAHTLWHEFVDATPAAT